MKYTHTHTNAFEKNNNDNNKKKISVTQSISYLYNVCGDGQVIQMKDLALPVDFMHDKI